MYLVFRAVAEATEEAVLNSMAAAEGVTGYLGHRRESLADFLAHRRGRE
jgi:D-aminopeptidase